MQAKNIKIYENGALGGRCSDGGDRNPGGEVILLEAPGGQWANILIDVYIYIQVYMYIYIYIYKFICIYYHTIL